MIYFCKGDDKRILKSECDMRQAGSKKIQIQRQTQRQTQRQIQRQIQEQPTDL